MDKSPERLEVLAKIEDNERNGRWYEPVENDPEALELLPNKVDYLNKKLTSKIKTFFANKGATKFYEDMIKKGQFIIKGVTGIENFLSVEGGAILTCNHFNPCDNYAVWRSIKPYMGKRLLYRVIREGNYTNFPNPIGFFFRNCNTLPLSRNTETMKKFLSAMKVLLERGEKVLVFPEQEMWWNYRKPRPPQPGAYRFAVTSSVPVIPVFITMEDSETIGQDGFPIQAYTVNFLPPIYPNSELSKKDNIQYMADANYKACVKAYEEGYGIKLKYLK
ncbi:MAG: 1-acyl-sn-glycerol-3-phosphate acyltransferase [Clostridiales bacterium]|nr:1-acyl-sn-glycerol-3-phosphate acyltransferase [Clostridiales bacterium]